MEEREKRDSSCSEALGLLRRLREPLLFAMADDFARLAQLKSLEPTAWVLIEQLSGLLPRRNKGLVSAMKATLAGFDSAPPERRRAKVIAALALCKQISKALSPEPASKPAAANATPQPKRPPAAASRLKPDSPVTALRGVGPAMAAKLARLDINKAADLLYLLPRRYEDLRNLKPVSGLVPGEVAVVRGEVLGARLAGFRRQKSFEAVLADGSATVALKFFHFSLERAKKLFTPGRRLIVSGEVSEFAGRLQFIHPDVEPEAPEGGSPARIRAVYPATEGLPQRAIRRLVAQALPLAEAIPLPLPGDICLRLRLPRTMAEAMKGVHLPEPSADIDALNRYDTPAQRALIFEELFFFQLGLLSRRRSRSRERGIAFPDPQGRLKEFASALPFRLTRAQERVLAEIAQDMAAPRPMNRLIQGDVGCGKTAVALGACYAAIQAGYQAALMAPTEILAEQHLRSAARLPELGLRPVFLTSRLKRAERREALRLLATGEANLAVGTHAILEEEVEFARLGLAVADEQHRFGVLQRQALLAKGARPDVLLMSATPIPRSLALTVYGDLDLSVIDELPAGRTPIRTRVLQAGQRALAFSLLKKEVAAGGQAYVVYPLVEESDRLALKSAVSQFEELKLRLAGLRLGLIHGRLGPEERDAVLTRFRQGELDVLVATTVVEVGLDVPNASLMLVEHAERFGLSQLHQLRGRVGRGERPATCLLLSGSTSEQARRRLAVMEETSDGFRIAEADLKLRGPGEFLGVRQSGLPGFRVADVLRDARLLALARREAERYLASGGLAADAGLRRELAARWGERLQLVGVG